MRYESAAIAERNDVAFGDIVASCGLDHERVPGPEHGQHAPSGDAEAQRARRVQYLAGQFALPGVRIAQGWLG
jgi:hypothetical protein